jgi:hypothetical protein
VRRRERRRAQLLHDGVVHGLSLRGFSDRFQGFVELLCDHVSRFGGRRCPAHSQSDAVSTAALEQLAEHVEHAVDETPCEVAPGGRDQQLARTIQPLFLGVASRRALSQLLDPELKGDCREARNPRTSIIHPALFSTRAHNKVPVHVGIAGWPVQLLRNIVKRGDRMGTSNFRTA